MLHTTHFAEFFKNFSHDAGDSASNLAVSFNIMRASRMQIRLISSLLLLLMGASVLSQSTADSFSVDEQKEILESVSKAVTERAFVPGVDFAKWPDYLQKHREAIDGAQSKRTFISQVNRTLREFGLSHIRLRIARNTGPDGGVWQTAPPTEDPKQEAPKQEEPKRETPERPKVQSLRWIDEESAVFRLTTFSTGYDQAEVQKLIGEAKAKAKYLLIDLRGNGGGQTGNLQHLLSYFLEPDSVIGTFVSRGDANRFASETKGDPKDTLAIAKWAKRKFKTRKPTGERFTGSIAVLIDRGSASASEITAAALKENLKVPLVGAPTAGAVLLSTFMKMPHGLELQIPLRDYVTKDGVRLEGNPLKPDIPVLTRDREEAIKTALEKLREKKS